MTMKTIIYDTCEMKIADDSVLENLNFNEAEFNLHFFDTLEFHKYHEKNCEKAYRILNIKKNKVIASYYFGIRNNEAYMPYSSPFSKFIMSKELSYEGWNTIITSMKYIAKELGVSRINITLPPFIYDKKIETQLLMLLNNGFKIKYIDINHYFDLQELESIDAFIESLPNKQRKRDYNRVIREGLKFYKLDSENFEEAFKIIEINRKQKGYPLRMSKEQIDDILKFKCSNVDFFIVENVDLDKIAAAMVYKVNDDVYQVIYWGHLEEYNNQRPMALLSAGLYQYYKEKGIKYLDIGPSSENGLLNINLAQFKVDIGCKDTSKFSLSFEL